MRPPRRVERIQLRAWVKIEIGYGMSLYYGLIPAAGTGARMGSTLPKQYLDIAGHPMIYYAARVMAAAPRITQVFVVISMADEYWYEYDWAEFGDKLVVLRCGGATAMSARASRCFFN